MKSDLKRALIICGLLCIVVALAIVGPLILSFFPQYFSNKYIPDPPSEYVLTQLDKSVGFDTLISYTDNGFEPTEMRIVPGEAIRFTNNSSGDLWIASDPFAEAPYPIEGNCGATAFNSCGSIPPHEFWEFTFAEPGVWAFENTLDKSKTGVIFVQAQ
ncbi:hypothetical protein H7X87_04185 [Acetobacteraceae bacterium]|nr:hypothetical protein [Candidatus Parcubacteria bacterium]